MSKSRKADKISKSGETENLTEHHPPMRLNIRVIPPGSSSLHTANYIPSVTRDFQFGREEDSFLNPQAQHDHLYNTNQTRHFIPLNQLETQNQQLFSQYQLQPNTYPHDLYQSRSYLQHDGQYLPRQG